MAYFKDLREHLIALEERGALIKIKRPINKDTELHPLVRLQFRGLPEEERKAFLFENVYDSRGRNYDSPVAVAAIAASMDVYATGMMCNPEDINKRLDEARRNSIKPLLISSGPVHEEIHVGDTLMEHGGLDEFPIPISTPGFDPAPFFSSPYIVTKDPDTGIQNVGTYRCHLKSPTRTGICMNYSSQDFATHWRMCKERGVPLQAAIIVGAAPNIAFTSVAKLSYGVDEFAVAGGIAGAPVEQVKCITVDLEVPAYAEIVIEGEVPTDEFEPEAPFGESLGYIGLRKMSPFINVTCITHRKNPIWQSFISQFPPSESSQMRLVSWGHTLYYYLRHELNMTDVLEVAFHQQSGSQGYIVIKMKKTESSEVMLTLEAAARKFSFDKIIVAVDEDIDPWNSDLVNWAMSFRVQPHRDVKIIKYPATYKMDYSIEAPTDGELREPDIGFEDLPDYSVLLIDATLKWPYPPVSLPAKEFMENALKIWKEEGLPPLQLKTPLWGYNLGLWSKENELEAKLAVEGEYYKTGEKLAKGRKRV
ncbi:UbiD family decarboxylase [Chloroflexota bacterium]